MTTYNAPHLAHLAGVPSQTSDTINPGLEGLLVGHEPGPLILDMTIAANQAFDKPYTPVGFDADGNLVPATWHATYEGGGVRAIGILMRPLTTGAAPLKGEPIVRALAVNMDMINWPASYDTTAKKLKAFEGAPSPSQFAVKIVRKGATVAAP